MIKRARRPYEPGNMIDPNDYSMHVVDICLYCKHQNTSIAPVRIVALLHFCWEDDEQFKTMMHPTARL